MRMRGCGVASLMVMATGCGARRAPPEPRPQADLQIKVEQAFVAESELLLVGMSIGTSNPEGVIVDEVDASAILQGLDLGELSLVPVMEAHMPPWTLMLMWRIPPDGHRSEGSDSSVAGTVAWRVGSAPQEHTSFQLQLQLAPAEGGSEESP